MLTLKQNGEVGNTIPAKLQEYMSTGKPVFASVGLGARMIIEDSNCGVVCDASDYISLASNMKDFILNSDKYVELGHNGRDYYYNNFTIDSFLKKLLNLFNK